jgi:Bcr/CflA subfamily drug resistance transporter
MKAKIGLVLLTALMMFPQIVETIYSPALTGIASAFSVNASQAGQTLSLYFFAFAPGVVFWGRVCDLAGRRPAVLAGLTLYGMASLLALSTRSFDVLLTARMLAAFGAAAGSVCTQTLLRDSFTGQRLAQIFSVMGVALAVSPLIGMLTGTALNHYFGYQGVFSGLALLATTLLCWAVIKLPETRPAGVAPISMLETLRLMSRDRHIWRTALLVALFNLNLFSYYQLAPFEFERLGYPPAIFGYGGVILALGTVSGAWLNKILLSRGVRSAHLVALAGIVSLAGGIGVTILLHFNSLMFLGAEALIVMGFGMAIPNILSAALVDYNERKGTAGAILGLFYYLLLGGGLVLAAWLQALGWVAVGSSALVLLLVYGFTAAGSER